MVFAFFGRLDFAFNGTTLWVRYWMPGTRMTTEEAQRRAALRVWRPARVKEVA